MTAVAVVGDWDQHLDQWVAGGAAQIRHAVQAYVSGVYLKDDCE